MRKNGATDKSLENRFAFAEPTTQSRYKIDYEVDLIHPRKILKNLPFSAMY